MYYIISIALVIISLFCVYKVFFSDEKPGYIRSVIGIYTTIIFIIGLALTLACMFTGVEITPNTITTQSQAEIAEFNKSPEDENYVTYKTKDGTETVVAADSNIRIFIKNDNPSEVIIEKKCKFSVFPFECEKTQTYTFQ